MDDQEESGFRPITVGQSVTPWKKHRVHELRRDMTVEERLLWERLRNGKCGRRFRRQQLIEGFIVDFYCPSARLAVEVDGAVHDMTAEADARRDAVLRARGIETLRIASAAVRADIDSVITRIDEMCTAFATGRAPRAL